MAVVRTVKRAAAADLVVESWNFACPLAPNGHKSIDLAVNDNLAEEVITLDGPADSQALIQALVNAHVALWGGLNLEIGVDSAQPTR